MFRTLHKRALLYLGLDLPIFIFACLISLFLFKDHKLPLFTLEWSYIVVMALVWFPIGYISTLYESKPFFKFNSRLAHCLKVYVIFAAFLVVLFNVLPIPVPSGKVLLATGVIFPALALSINFIILKLNEKAKLIGENKKYALIAGVGSLAQEIETTIGVTQHKKYQVKGFIKCKKEECAVQQDKIVGDVDHINEYLSTNSVDEIVIALPVKVPKKVKNIIAAADYHGVRVKCIPDFRGVLGNKYKMIRYNGLDAINVRQLPLDETYAFLIKNCFDKVFSFFALIALSPLFLVIAALIKLDSPGPVFYCPLRIGKGGKPFKVYKFRSMRVNDDANGGTQSTRKNDPRITKIGFYLRKYSLDELPQFFNVLLGDMSVVGPRPHRGYLNQQLQASVDKYMIRHYFKPGITGWAQVNGWRGPTETDEQRTQRTLHDIWYMENWSFLLDVKIIWRTVFDSKVHKSAF